MRQFSQYTGSVYSDYVILAQLLLESVPRSKHFVSVIKTSQLMLYREIIAVCSQIHTKHKYTVWAERGIFVC
jgi:hypothetical protein